MSARIGLPDEISRTVDLKPVNVDPVVVCWTTLPSAERPGFLLSTLYVILSRLGMIWVGLRTAKEVIRV